MSNPDNNVLSATEMAAIRTQLHAARALSIQTADLSCAVRVLAETLETEAHTAIAALHKLEQSLPAFDLDD